MVNIFDNSDETVPVSAIIDGERVQIGEARLGKIENGIVHIEANLKTDDIEDVKSLLGSHLVNDFSIDTPKHEHNPVQHRDGKPPWCRECGLTEDYKVPVSKLSNPVKPAGYGFGKPANPIHRSIN